MNSVIKVFVFTIILSSSINCLSEIKTSRCSLRGNDITDVANKITKNNSNEMPEAYLNQTEFEAEFTSEGQKFSGVIEGFYRPAHTVKMSIIPTAIAAVELKRNTHVIYVCAEVNEDNDYRLEIYFLGKTNHTLSQFQKFMTDVEKNDSITVVPLQLSILSLGLDGQPNAGKNLLKFLILPYYLQTKIFSGFANAFSAISGINIERVVLTKNNVQIAGGIDLNNPDHPRFSKTITFDSDEGKLLTTFDVNQK